MSDRFNTRTGPSVMTPSTGCSQAIGRRQAVGVLALTALALGLKARGAQAAQSVLRSADFESLALAMEAWRLAGGTLIINQDHQIDRPLMVQFLPGKSYRLTTDGPKTIRYVGDSSYHWLVCLYSPGDTPFVIDGSLTIDGQEMVSIPFFARFENVGGDRRRDFTVRGLNVRNARMRRGINRIDGSPANAYGATGMLFAGGFDHLHLSNVRAENVGRDEGAGLSGSKGSIGIGVTARLGTTQSARHVTIEDFEVVNVGSDDRPGSKVRGDMDGVLVFQSAEKEGTRPLIQRGIIREAAGRAIKVFAPGGGGVTRDIKIYRSVAGQLHGSAEVNHQHGDGRIENIEIFYSGQAHFGQTVAIGFAASHRRPPEFPFGTAIVRNVKIHDSTGAAKHAVVGFQYNYIEPHPPRRVIIERISDEGSSRYFFLPGVLGTHGVVDVTLARISTKLMTSLFASDDRTHQMRLSVSGFTNRGAAAVPVKTFYNGRRASPSHRVGYQRGTSVKGLSD